MRVLIVKDVNFIIVLVVRVVVDSPGIGTGFDLFNPPEQKLRFSVEPSEESKRLQYRTAT
jgi:hypothetical protein